MGGGWRYSHVHDVGFVQGLVFDLGVDDGRVGDPCGVRARRSRDHVVGEPARSRFCPIGEQLVSNRERGTKTVEID